MTRQISFDWLDIPVSPRVVFETSPLSLALCQIRFPPVLSIAKQDWVAPFQEAIREDYPNGSPIQQNVQVQIQLSGASSVASSTGPAAWRFADLEDNWAVTLATDSVALETRAYQDFDDFLRRLDQMLHVLVQFVHPAITTRLGLRYINELRPGHNDWPSVIRPELLGAVAVPQFSTRTVQSVQQLALRDAEGAGINVNHGVFPEGTIVNPRPGDSISEGPFYLLDLDVFQEFSRRDVLPINVALICQRVETYHDAISRLFRWSITENFASTLGRRNDGIG
jgi:uncharacterized protein (TIGR04255 family)